MAWLFYDNTKKPSAEGFLVAVLRRYKKIGCSRGTRFIHLPGPLYFLRIRFFFLHQTIAVGVPREHLKKYS